MMTARVKGELVKSELYQPVPAERGSMGFYGGGGGLYSTVQRLCSSHARSSEWRESRWSTCLVRRDGCPNVCHNQISSIDVSPGKAQIKALSNDFDMGFGSSAKWGLGFLLSPEGTESGRGRGSASWAGLFFNSYFWIDRENDLCALFATQVLPFYDEEAVSVLKLFRAGIWSIS